MPKLVLDALFDVDGQGTLAAKNLRDIRGRNADSFGENSLIYPEVNHSFARLDNEHLFACVNNITPPTFVKNSNNKILTKHDICAIFKLCRKYFTNRFAVKEDKLTASVALSSL